MNFIARKFGTLFFLALVVGAGAGAVMAQKGMQVDLGTVAGVKLALAQPTPTKAALILPTGAATGTGQSATGGAAALAAARGTTGTVQQVSGTTITVTAQDGSVAKATVNSSTTYLKNNTITLADLKAGDTVTVIGQAAADGSITAQQVTAGAINAAAATAAGAGFTRGGAGGPGAFGAQAGTGITGTGGTAITGTGIQPGAGISGTGGFGRPGAGTGITGTGGTAITGTGGAGRQGAGGTGTGGAAPGAGQFANEAVVSGTIEKISATSLTVTVAGGQSTIVNIDATTRLRKTATGALSDVTTGEQVTITGQTGADGSIAAIAVQIGALR